MNWIKLEQLLLKAQPERAVTADPALNHAQLCEQALSLAAGLQAQGVQRIAVHLDDAADLAIALLGAWRAGVSVLLPADLQPQTRQRWSSEVDLWLTDQADDAQLSDYRHAPLSATALDLDRCTLSLCTSGSSGEPKRIDKNLRQLANEVQALEQLWGVDLAEACIIGSVATQHIYGLLFRVLWPLCAGRSFVRKQLAFPEDLQRASREHPAFAWVASPALLKRMGDNLDWPALSAVRRVFSSGGALPAEAALSLQQRLHQWPTEILGSSETGGIAWRQGNDLWQAFAGIELSQDSDGALLIASPYLPPGHVEHTADAARIAADGRFELLGRLDRIVKLEEKRISLPMLEHALMAHDWVCEARLGVVQENRASLGALLVLSESGLHALRNQGAAPSLRNCANTSASIVKPLHCRDAGACCDNCRSTLKANCLRPTWKPYCWPRARRRRKCWSRSKSMVSGACNWRCHPTSRTSAAISPRRRYCRAWCKWIGP